MRIDRKKSPQPTTRAIIRLEYLTCIKKSTTRLALVKAMSKAIIGLKTPKFWKATQVVSPVKKSRVIQMIT